MRVSVRVDGAVETERMLSVIDNRVTRPVRPLLDILAAEMQSAYRTGIQSRGLDLPKPHWLTEKIRRHYGHDAKARLVRGGDLIRSITVLRTGEDFVDVGSPLSFARLLHEGGTKNDPPPRRDALGKFSTSGARSGRSTTRQVQAHPFLVTTDELLRTLEDDMREYFLPTEGDA